MFATVCMLVPLSIAVVTDVRRHTIYNWTVYPGILLALLISLLATVAGRDMIQGSAADVAQWGVPHVWSALGGLCSCGAIMLVCYVFFPGSLGGGDVKLLAMLGAFLGPAAGIEVMLWTFVLGGCLGLVMLVWQVGLWQLLLRLLRCVRSVVTAAQLVAVDGGRAASLAGAAVSLAGGLDGGGYRAIQPFGTSVSACNVKRSSPALLISPRSCC